MLTKLIIIIPIISFLLLLFVFYFFNPLKYFNTRLNNLPFIISASFIVFILIVILVYISFNDGYDMDSSYHPPYIEDGKLIQGDFKSK